MEQMKNDMSNNKITGIVHSVESFGSVDGPGVRYIVFLQGCHMRCRYCHNPETWALTGGTEMTADEILEKALRYKSYWKNNGGITVSGGEALVQIDFVIDLFKKAKALGVNTTLDTSGNPFTRENPFFDKFNELMKYTDLYILDIKHIDDEKHKQITGWTNKNIIDMAQYLSDHQKDMWIRHVLVPGLTDNDDDLKRLDTFVKSLKTVKRFEVLPYHTLGVFMYENLGIDYTLKDVMPPTQELIAHANEILETESYTGYKE